MNFNNILSNIVSLSESIYFNIAISLIIVVVMTILLSIGIKSNNITYSKWSLSKYVMLCIAILMIGGGQSLTKIDDLNNDTLMKEIVFLEKTINKDKDIDNVISLKYIPENMYLVKYIENKSQEEINSLIKNSLEDKKVSYDEINDISKRITFLINTSKVR